MDFNGSVSNFLKTHRGFVLFFAVVLCTFLLQSHSVFAATYTVTVTTDTDDSTCDADCSLREAVDDANAAVGLDTIDFAGGLTGGTITLLSVLPSLTEQAVVDGTALVAPITIVGSPFTESIITFDNTGSGNVIKGMTLVGAEGTANCIYSLGTTGLTVGGSVAGSGNVIDACGNGIRLNGDTGTSILGNSIGATTANTTGIYSTSSTTLAIGGPDAEGDDKNIVVNSTLSGVVLTDITTVSIVGNWIGTENGTTDDGNGGWGIFIDGTSSGVTIGGTTALARNIISGNQGGGVDIATDTVTTAVIQGNYIGTASDGVTALGNSYHGIDSYSAITIGGTAAGSGNVITANNDANVWVGDAGGTLSVANGTGCTIQGNMIGVDKNSAALTGGQNTHGVLIKNSHNTIGGTDAGAKNVISGNAWWGIFIQGDLAIAEDNSVQGNYIGTNSAGDAAVANGGGGIGIGIDAATTTIGGSIAAGAGNLISGNTSRGIFVDSTAGDGHVIQGNIIGLNLAMTADVGNTWSGVEIQTNNNTVGGDTTDSRNWISGNDQYGIALVVSSGNTIKNNYVGTGTAGIEGLGNALDGVFLMGASANNIIGTAGSGNIIVDNDRMGVWIDNAAGVDNSIKGNYIGVDVTGAADLGNAGNGIQTSGSGTVIGGVGAGDENLISGNTGHGIYITGGSGSIIKGNNIGTNAAGTAAITNDGSGIHMDGGAAAVTIGGSIAAGAGNLISGNTQRGIFIDSTAGDGHGIQGNIIGLNAGKTACIANAWSGIENYADDNTIGGDTTDYRNWSSCNQYGIIASGDRNVVKNNYIGTGVFGTEDFGNTADGVYLQSADSDGNIIGAAGVGNLIVFNDGSGISITGGATSDGNSIQGNYIGLALDGTTDQGNAVHGIYTNGTGTIIGGSIVAGEGNMISGNGQRGLHTDGAETTVKGNYVGTNAAGTGAVTNGGEGMWIGSSDNTIGGTTADERNIVSGNTGTGIIIVQTLEGIAVENNVVEGNYIGVASNGTADLGNGGQGVHLTGALTQNNTIGGTAASSRNIISGNAGTGVWIQNTGTGNTVAGNHIGTNAAGTGAIANDAYGISIENSSSNTIGGTTVGSRNVISGNANSGIYVVSSSSANTIKNNYIGVDSTGNVDLGNGDADQDSGVFIAGSSAGNFIGTAGYGNVISGNFFRGIYILDAGSANSIQANIVGLGADGTTAIGNDEAGITIVRATGTIIGTANTSARNIVASNGSHGIWIHDVDSAVVVNNYVGVASDGTTARTNTGDGIYLENTTDSSTIGGTATGAGNTIKASGTNSCIMLVADAYHYNNIRHNSCLNESATELNIERLGSSNEAAAVPVILAATGSRVNGTTIFDTGAIDIFVDGVYTASTTASGGVWSKDVAISGTNVSASVTNATNSTSSTSAFTAIVADVANPTVSTLSPTDGATGVSTTANLVLTFNESVDAESGNIVIKKTLDNSTVETIPVTDGRVTGSGTTTITINPTANLAALTGYYVQIAATGFDDFSSRSYAGITDTTSWNFITAGTAGVTASAISGATTEAAAAATFTVVLDTQPTADVVVPMTSSDVTEGTISPASLTFTSANWATPQTVTVTGVNDAVDDGNISYSAVLGSTTSDDSNYSGINPADVSVTNTDDDVAGVTVSAISGDTTEAAGTSTFTVVLTSQPTADVSVPVVSSDTTEGTVSVSSLTFTSENWDTPQTITVTGVDDSTADGDIAYSIVLSSVSSEDAAYTLLNPGDVNVTNVDDDTVGITVSAISGNTSEAGANATFTVKLNTAPTADVTIAVSSSDTTEGTVSVSTLTFTANDWGNQTVTVTGVSDAIDDGSVAYTIVLGAATSDDSAYHALNPDDVSVTNTEDDATDGGSIGAAPVFTGSLPTVSFIAGGDAGALSITTTGVMFDLDEYFSDPDSDPLVYTVSGNSTVIVTIDDSGEVTFGAPVNFSGVESIVFTATDPDGLIGVSNPVSVSVSIASADSIINRITGTPRGAGIIRTYDQNNILLNQWVAFPKGGVIPRVSSINGTEYIFAVKKDGGSTMHVYDTSGGLLASKRLSARIHLRRIAIGNLNDATNTKEIAVAAQRGTTVYVKVFRFNADTHTFVLLKRHRIYSVRKSYRLVIQHKKVQVIANGTGKALYSWQPF